MEAFKITLGKAKCGLDLGDGSERAEYVNQDYILHKLGRPHRCVNIMYTLYPKDAQWPQRISKACADMDVKFQWDYPYDDYFPFGADGEPFEQMKDIRRHGQDVLLTLTVDCSLDDEYLRGVAKQFAEFGRMRIRINHECQGNWFTHNKRFTFEEIGAFFVRFRKILKEEAPNVKAIFCAGFIKPDGKIDQEDAFLEAYKAADVWSADSYPALHFGWPYDVAEVGGGSYKADNVREIYEQFEATAKRLREITGKHTPMTTAESNTDGDVTGPFHQGEAVVKFAEYFRDNNTSEWFDGISMYQFRDRGRLGLEIEDPNNNAVGIEQPVLADYKKLIQDPYFLPSMTKGEKAAFPAKLRWGGADDADGIELPIAFVGTPEFCEATFEEDASLMIELGGKWFYKAKGVKTIDFMSLFFEKQLDGPTVLPMRIFGTPADGVNPKTDAPDWATNYYCELKTAPELRIRYEVPGRVGLV
ncbi:MAG: hypothetical protein IJU80_10625 [Lachnospiraceae bacterium]|nr:hypothetical protein [Lachnospiraceae bacterium]